MSTPFHHSGYYSERKAREELPCVSETLSSIRRPYSFSPPSSSRGLLDLLLAPLAPQVPFLHLVIPYISNFAFAFRLPFLSHSYQYLYTDEQLHQREVKQRCDLSDARWEEFSASPLLQLRMPVHKFAYYQADHQDDDWWYEWTEEKPHRAWGGGWEDYEELTDEDEELSGTDQAAGTGSKRKVRGAKKRGGKRKAKKRKITRADKMFKTHPAFNCAVDGVIPWNIHTWDKLTVKDWSLECPHLYQRLHFASLYLMRHAPNITSTGERIHYHLPTLFNRLIVEQLISDRPTYRNWSSSVHGIVRGVTFQGMDGWRASVVGIEYTFFSTRSSPKDSVTLDLRDRPSAIPYTFDPEEEMRFPSPQFPPIPPLRPSTAIESPSVEQAMKRWEDEKWEERVEKEKEKNGEEEDEGSGAPSSLKRVGQRRQRQLLGELVVCAGVEEYQTETEPPICRPLLFHALHVGPAVRKRMEEVKEGVIEVDLTDCPVVQYPRNVDDPDPVVVALSAEEWVQQGCVRAMQGQWQGGQVDRGLTLSHAKTLAQRLGMQPWWVEKDYLSEEAKVKVERSGEISSQQGVAEERLQELMQRVRMKEADEMDNEQ